MLKKISAFGLLSLVALTCAAVPAKADQSNQQLVDQSGAIVGTFNGLDQHAGQTSDQYRRDLGFSGPQDSFQGTRQAGGVSGFGNWLDQTSHQDNDQKSTLPYGGIILPTPPVLYH